MASWNQRNWFIRFSERRSFDHSRWPIANLNCDSTAYICTVRFLERRLLADFQIYLFIRWLEVYIYIYLYILWLFLVCRTTIIVQRNFYNIFITHPFFSKYSLIIGKIFWICCNCSIIYSWCNWKKCTDNGIALFFSYSSSLALCRKQEVRSQFCLRMVDRNPDDIFAISSRGTIQ